jgi:hypothetical protein
MPERELENDSALEFESVPARSDVRVSKKFETPVGDEIRVIHTVGGNAILTKAGRGDGPLDSAFVTGDSDTIAQAKKGFWGKVWGKIKDAAKAVGDAVEGIDCKLSVSIKIGKNGIPQLSIEASCS